MYIMRRLKTVAIHPRCPRAATLVVTAILFVIAFVAFLELVLPGRSQIDLDNTHPDGHLDYVTADEVLRDHQNYHGAHGHSQSRLVTSSYRRWVDLALSRRCAVEEQAYIQIDKEMRRFRHAFAERWLSSNAGTVAQQRLGLNRVNTLSNQDIQALVEAVDTRATVITSEMMDDAARLPYTVRVRVGDGKVQVEHGSIPPVIFEALQEVAHLPRKSMDLVFNLLDEPRVLKRSPDKRRYNVRTDPTLDYDPLTGLYQRKGTGCESIVSLMESVCDGENDVDGISRKQLESHGFFLAPASLHFTDHLLPVLSSSTVGACFADIIFPSHYYLQARVESRESSSFSLNIADERPSTWDSKSDTLFWRGSSTSGCAMPGNAYPRFHRQRFVERFGAQASLTTSYKINRVNSKHSFDVGFTEILQCHGDACDSQSEKYGPILPRVPQHTAYNYKYLADIDGNTFSQRFLAFLRHSNSLVIKLALFEDWLTAQTIAGPNGHYLSVPLPEFTTALPAQLQWARAHDVDVRLIAQRAHVYAHRRLRHEDMICYLGRVLVEMEALTAEGSGRLAVWEYLKDMRQQGRNLQM